MDVLVRDLGARFCLFVCGFAGGFDKRWRCRHTLPLYLASGDDELMYFRQTVVSVMIIVAETPRKVTDSDDLMAARR